MGVIASLSLSLFLLQTQIMVLWINAPFVVNLKTTQGEECHDKVMYSGGGQPLFNCLLNHEFHGQSCTRCTFSAQLRLNPTQSFLMLYFAMPWLILYAKSEEMVHHSHQNYRYRTFPFPKPSKVYSSLKSHCIVSRCDEKDTSYA